MGHVTCVVFPAGSAERAGYEGIDTLAGVESRSV